MQLWESEAKSSPSQCLLSVQGNKNIRNLLNILKDEILKQTGAALPHEIRLLDELIREKEEDVRLRKLQVYSPCTLCVSYLLVSQCRRCFVGPVRRHAVVLVHLACACAQVAALQSDLNHSGVLSGLRFHAGAGKPPCLYDRGSGA